MEFSILTLCMVFVLCVNEGYGQIEPREDKLTKKEKRKFRAHFRCLESCAASNPTDTIFRCCKQSIDFMVNKTEIESKALIISWIGRTSFTRADLDNWRQWFAKYMPTR